MKSDECVLIYYALVVELVDTLVLEASARAWGFESLLGHHIKTFCSSYTGVHQVTAKSTTLWTLPGREGLPWIQAPQRVSIWLWSRSINGDAVDCKSAAYGTPGSIPGYSTKLMEVWQSPVYCNSLENCRSEMVREFESHRFRQNKSVRKYDRFLVILSCIKP